MPAFLSMLLSVEYMNKNTMQTEARRKVDEQEPVYLSSMSLVKF